MKPKDQYFRRATEMLPNDRWLLASAKADWRCIFPNTVMNVFRLTCLLLCALPLVGVEVGALAQAPDGPQQLPSKKKNTDVAESTGAVPTKKLMLKDGKYQLVRSYERKGERVRYLSAERGDWEELPEALVDWEATTKTEEAERSAATAMIEKVHAREAANRTEAVMDVDASLMVAPGVFLPPGEGMFAVRGKSVTQLEQVGSQVKTDKKNVLKQILSPIPIVPSKQNVQIPGAKAKIRVEASSLATKELPEFYLREAPPDPERNGAVRTSSRAAESGPEVELVRATVKGNKRQLESIRRLFGSEVGTERKTISVQRWEVTPTVFRFTLSEPLPPGEYALAEILPDGMNLFVWDFGVDGPPAPKPTRR